MIVQGKVKKSMRDSAQEYALWPTDSTPTIKYAFSYTNLILTHFILSTSPTMGANPPPARQHSSTHFHTMRSIRWPINLPFMYLQCEREPEHPEEITVVTGRHSTGRQD